MLNFFQFLTAVYK